MEISELLASGFTAAMIAVSLIIIAARSRRRPRPAGVRRRARVDVETTAAGATLRVVEPRITLGSRQEPIASRQEPVASREPIASRQEPVASSRQEPRPLALPRSDPPKASAARAASNETFTVLKNDQEIGPITFDELTNYVEQNLVKETELVKASNAKSWVKARDIPGLFPPPPPLEEPRPFASAPSTPLAPSLPMAPRERLAAARAEPIEARPRTAERRVEPQKPAPRKSRPHVAYLTRILMIAAVAGIAGLAWIGRPHLLQLYRLYESYRSHGGETASATGNPFATALVGVAASDSNGYAEALRNKLLSDPLYAQVHEIDPARFDQIVQAFAGGIDKGLAGDDLVGAARPLLNTVYSEALPYASDEDLIQSLRLTVDTAQTIKTNGTSDCYFYLHETQGGPGVAEAIAKRFPEQIGAEWRLKGKIISAFTKKDRKIIESKIAYLYQDKIWGAVKSQFGGDADVLFDPNIAADKMQLHCAVAIVYYGEILKMPTDEAADFFRFLLLSQ